MMRCLLRFRVLALPVSLLLVAPGALARDVHCAWGGPAAGILTFADLTLAGPDLDETVIEYDSTGMERRRSDVQLISSRTVCGVPLDFRTACTSEEYENGTLYEWSFRCGNQLSGLVHLEAVPGGLASRKAIFYCRGDDVPQRYQRRTWWGCR